MSSNLSACAAGCEAAAALLTPPSPLRVEISAVCSLLNAAQTPGPEANGDPRGGGDPKEGGVFFVAETGLEAGSSAKQNGAGGEGRGRWVEEVGEAVWGALEAAHTSGGLP